MNHRTPIFKAGKLPFVIHGGRISVAEADVLKLIAALSPARCSSATDAERYLKRFRYGPGNDDTDKLGSIAERLYSKFPLLAEDVVYSLLRQHSDSFGQDILFADLRRAAALWGAATR